MKHNCWLWSLFPFAWNKFSPTQLTLILTIPKFSWQSFLGTKLVILLVFIFYNWGGSNVSELLQTLIKYVTRKIKLIHYMITCIYMIDKLDISLMNIFIAGRM